MPPQTPAVNKRLLVGDQPPRLSNATPALDVLGNRPTRRVRRQWLYGLAARNILHVYPGPCTPGLQWAELRCVGCGWLSAQQTEPAELFLRQAPHGRCAPDRSPTSPSSPGSSALGATTGPARPGSIAPAAYCRTSNRTVLRTADRPGSNGRAIRSHIRMPYRTEDSGQVIHTRIALWR